MLFETAVFPLAGDRFTPLVDTIEVVGIDLTGATFKMQVRDRKDGGTVRADLATVGSVGTEGVTLVGVTTDGDAVPTSTLSFRINEATMEAMPDSADGLEAGADVPLWWDMHITPSGGVKFVAFAGVFTVRAGVTE